jgi:hypothetical protein
MRADLRLGRYQDVLADVEPDSLIGDGPFGRRTHEGHNSANAPPESGCFPNKLAYDHWTETDVLEFVDSWAPRTRDWIVQHTTLASEPGTSLRAAGWRVVADVRGRSWHCKSRPRVDRHPTQDKLRWEAGPMVGER